MNLAKYWHSFLALFFPINCVACSRQLVNKEEILCLHCYHDLPKAKYHLSRKNPLRNHISSTIELEAAYAFLKYKKKGIAQKLIHLLKYEGIQTMGRTLGQWMAKDFRAEISSQQIDLIMPVPLHRSRHLKRGFNQSLELAKGMSEILHIPIADDVVKRKYMNRSQAKKGKLDRIISAPNDYVIKNAEKIRGLHVLVVDDIVTTGSTITSVCTLLREHGADQVSVACFATGR